MSGNPASEIRPGIFHIPYSLGEVTGYAVLGKTTLGLKIYLTSAVGDGTRRGTPADLTPT